MRVLVIEEKILPEFSLRDELNNYGFCVDWFASRMDGEIALLHIPYGAIIFYSGIPGDRELKMLSRWRNKSVSTPVIVITDFCQAGVRASILNAGADDCMQKPLEVDELVARICAIVRRSHAIASPLLKHGTVSMDTGSREVRLNGQPVKLTARETTMLELFLLNKKRIMGREYLNTNICTWFRDIGSNAVEVHIHHLRRKLGRDFIQTVRGHGYRLSIKNEA
ncbi:winged helix-turn-helix domain-containing protein [Salmonella enterica subsp. enterica]